LSILASGKTMDLFFMIIIWSVAVIYIYVVGGDKFNLKRMVAIDAIDEAIGRAEEMGRPVVMNIGGGGLLRGEYAPPTMAGLTVLGHVAGITARLGTELIAPMYSSGGVETIPVATEIIRDAYMAEGAIERFHPEDMIRFLPVQASVMALADRERPAANLMIGYFWHESMIWAEAFGRVGAIQIGGTTNLYQIPFFAGACDYVLIGEEIYPVSAYISKDPKIKATIAGQDTFKWVSIILMILGVILTTLGNDWLSGLLSL
jgi:hypothetical protein